MRKFTLLLAAMTICGLASSYVTPAFAQATHTWVSGVGDDANPCSRTAPCKTFAGAISKTLASGAISVLDPGGFGAVTITKSISIMNDYSGEAGILASGTYGITVNAGATDVVILRGLVIDGAPVTSTGLTGIRVLQVGALHIEKCLIKNFGGAAPNGNGIQFTPSNAGAKLFVTDSYVVNNEANGILVQPTGGGSASVSINRTQLLGNATGFRADGTGSTGGISAAISDSLASGTVVTGYTSFSQAGSAATTVTIMNSVSANNGAGLNANGAAAVMRIGGSTVSGNATGIKISNGATMSSYSNNQINDNTVAGPTIPTIALQ
jgi:hypothetical protein